MSVLVRSHPVPSGKRARSSVLVRRHPILTAAVCEGSCEGPAGVRFSLASCVEQPTEETSAQAEWQGMHDSRGPTGSRGPFRSEPEAMGATWQR